MTKVIESSARLEMSVTDLPYADRQVGVVDVFDNIRWIPRGSSTSHIAFNLSRANVSSAQLVS